MKEKPHLQSLGFGILTSLQLSKPGDELDNFFSLKRRVVITLEMVLRPDGTDEGFTFLYPT